MHYLHATEEHKYLVDKVLRQDQGLTFDVFRDVETEPKAADGEEPPGEEEEPAKVKFKGEPTEVLPRTIFVKEVVREPRMHFFQVPRLGSYLAIRLEYQSCLFEESLDAAVADYLDVRHKLKEQEDEKKSFLDKMAAEDKDGDHHDESHLAQRKWDDIKHKPFKTQKV